MSGTVLQINNLTKYYGNIPALDNFSLSVNKGNVYGLLGPNGSGKTTTLSILLGIIKAGSGSFQWFENSYDNYAKKKIGSLIETPNFYPYLSAVQNLKIICEIKSIDYNDISRVLKIVNLFERKDSKYFSFSLGMRQRLALAALLLGDPDVLVLDEPTNGLDPEGIAEVRQIIIEEAEKGKTIIIASHILDEVEKVCSHVAILKKGKLIANGKVGDLLKSSTTVYVSSSNPNELHQLIIRSGLASSVEKNENDIILTLNDFVSIENINEYAYKNGIVLTKLYAQNKSLEAQFMELIKK